jgi:anti-sigma-K factor RskA
MTQAHPELSMAAPYALGALDDSERGAFAAHLTTCAECQAEVRSLERVALALAAAAPSRTPRAEMRDRVLTAAHENQYVVSGFSRTEATDAENQHVVSASAKATARSRRGLPASEASEVGSGYSRPGPTIEERRSRRWSHPSFWLPAAALLALAVGLGAHTHTLRRQIASLETRLAAALRDAAFARTSAAGARRDAMRVQNALAVLASSDMARIELVGQSIAPSASARAFWSRRRGLVFTARDLPALPEGKVYQVWVLTGAVPISAGLVSPNAAGEAMALLDTSATIPQPVGVAVSLEPRGGVPQPTGQIYLAGKVGV